MRRARVGSGVGRGHRSLLAMLRHWGFPQKTGGTWKGLSKRKARPNLTFRWFFRLQCGVCFRREHE